LEGEVGVKRNILCSFFTFSQFGEDEETFPSTTLLGEHSETLDTNCKGVQVAPGDAARAHRTDGKHPSVDQESERHKNTDSEDPTRDSEGNSGFDAAAPVREGKQINSSECIDAINGNRNK
jgi:hypothetical protein